MRIVWSDDYEKTERSVLERAFSAVSEKGCEMDRRLLWRTAEEAFRGRPVPPLHLTEQSPAKVTPPNLFCLFLM